MADINPLQPLAPTAQGPATESAGAVNPTTRLLNPLPSSPPLRATSNSPPVAPTAVQDPSVLDAGASNSSSPPQKRTADDNSDILELVRQAKSSKTSKKPAEDDDLADALQKELTCSICAEIYLDPVLCTPCDHSFCGSCISKWLEAHTSCPSCRGRVTATRPNRVAGTLVDTLLSQKPDLKRPDEDINECRELYDWNKQIKICQHVEDYDDEDDDDVEEEPEELIEWDPCLSCPRGNDTGFECREPIHGQLQLPDHIQNYQRHTKCTFCDRTFPTDWKENYHCDCCNSDYCGAMFDCPSKPSGRDYITKFGDQVFCTEDNHPRRNSNGTTNYAQNFTEIEHNAFQKYLSDNNITWTEIGDKVRDYLLEQNAPDVPTGRRASDLRLCKSCAWTRFHRDLMRWWVWHKAQIDWDTGKPPCWYGFQCRTQYNNANHSARLDHACNPIPPGQRVNNAPPRDSVNIPHPSDVATTAAATAAAAVMSNGSNGSNAGSP